MLGKDMVRREFTLPREDAALLDEIAASRHQSVSSLVRQLLYANLRALDEAQSARELRALAEARDRAAIKKWVNSSLVDATM